MQNRANGLDTRGADLLATENVPCAAPAELGGESVFQMGGKVGGFDKKTKAEQANRPRSQSGSGGGLLSLPQLEGGMAPPAGGGAQSTYGQQRREAAPPSSHAVSSALQTMTDPRGIFGVGGALGLKKRIKELETGMARGAASGQQTKALALLNELADIAKTAFSQSCDATRANDQRTMAACDAKMTTAVQLFTALADKTEQYKLVKQARAHTDGEGHGKASSMDDGAYAVKKAEFGSCLAQTEQQMAAIR